MSIGGREWRYIAYTLKIKSDIKLFWPDVYWTGSPDIELFSERVGQDAMSEEPGCRSYRLVHRVSNSLQLWQGNGEYFIAIDRKLVFVVSPDGKKVTCRVSSERAIEFAKTFFVTYVLALCLCRRGYALLHSSAVSQDNKAVLFVGGNGSGKSTLAAGLVQEGFRLVGDDGVAFDLSAQHACVVPAYPAIKLELQIAKRFFPQSDLVAVPLREGGKHVVSLAGPLFAAERIPINVKMVYVLKHSTVDSNPRMRIFRPNAFQIVDSLLKGFRVMHALSPNQLALCVERVCDLAKQGLVRFVSYPHTPQAFEGLCSEVIRSF